MNYLSFFLAQRFYNPKKTHFSIKFIAFLSKIGIIISVFALLISLSAVNGFQILLNKKILSSLPHGIIVFKNPSQLLWNKIKKK
ncbi:hypothetical protein [Buchnera aphidicola]|uniref:hypothetical protein n=1 Tax=Buchnera aphidicola TaxID=9 RepID=UPI003BEF168F